MRTEITSIEITSMGKAVLNNLYSGQEPKPGRRRPWSYRDGSTHGRQVK